METTLVVFFEKIIVYMSWKFWDGQNLAIFCKNWKFWRVLAFNYQTPLWIFLIFGMKVVLMAPFQKIILYLLENSDMARFGPFKAIFGQNWQFWKFLTYNFQTQLWIFLIFGMELLWILTLFGEPIILCLVSITFVFDMSFWLFLDIFA